MLLESGQFGKLACFREFRGVTHLTQIDNVGGDSNKTLSQIATAGRRCHFIASVTYIVDVQGLAEVDQRALGKVCVGPQGETAHTFRSGLPSQDDFAGRTEFYPEGLRNALSHPVQV